MHKVFFSLRPRKILKRKLKITDTFCQPEFFPKTSQPFKVSLLILNATIIQALVT